MAMMTPIENAVEVISLKLKYSLEYIKITIIFVTL